MHYFEEFGTISKEEGAVELSNTPNQSILLIDEFGSVVSKKLKIFKSLQFTYFWNVIIYVPDIWINLTVLTMKYIVIFFSGQDKFRINCNILTCLRWFLQMVGYKLQWEGGLRTDCKPPAIQPHTAAHRKLNQKY